MENPKKRNWKVLTSEYLARKPWFTVRHESLELPDGRRIPDYYVLEYPDWINVIAITRDGRFVFIDQYRHGLGRTSYEIVAGVRDPQDTTPLDAARRAGMQNVITFEFSHFMSPNSSYTQAGHLYNRYMEYMNYLQHKK